MKKMKYTVLDEIWMKNDILDNTFLVSLLIINNLEFMFRVIRLYFMRTSVV